MYYKFGLKHYYYYFCVYFNKYYYLLKKKNKCELCTTYVYLV